jgi:hypothetical protein
LKEVCKFWVACSVALSSIFLYIKVYAIAEGFPWKSFASGRVCGRLDFQKLSVIAIFHVPKDQDFEMA